MRSWPIIIAARPAIGKSTLALDVCRAAAGVSGPAIYRHFPNKESLLVELLVEHLEFLLSQWEHERPRNDEPVQRLRAFTDAAQLNATLQQRGLSLADVATLPEAERALARGALSFDDVLESMNLRANKLNFDVVPMPIGASGRPLTCSGLA